VNRLDFVPVVVARGFEEETLVAADLAVDYLLHLAEVPHVSAILSPCHWRWAVRASTHHRQLQLQAPLQHVRHHNPSSLT